MQGAETDGFADRRFRRSERSMRFRQVCCDCRADQWVRGDGGRDHRCGL